MRTGKHSISRGRQFSEQIVGEPKLRLVRPKQSTDTQGSQEPKPTAASVASPQALDRVGALERLARLRSLELLTAEEFTVAKAVVLSDHREDAASPFLPAEPVDDVLADKPPAGPSLVESLFSWKFLPAGIVAGMALSFGAQPQETMRLFDQALTILGV